MRRFVIGFGVFVIIVVAAVLIFVVTFNVNKYHGTIQSELEKRLGRPVTLGDMHLGFFPLRFQVQNPTIAEDPHFGTERFRQGAATGCFSKALPLLHKQVEVDSITLERPTVNLIKNQAGVWNFASVGHPSESPQTGAAAPSPEHPTSTPCPTAQQTSRRNNLLWAS